MSHFTVLVIGENPEQQLAPFQENNMGDCPKHLLKFNDIEEEHIAEYSKDECSVFISPEGAMYSKYDDTFRVLGKLLEPTKYVCPDGWNEKEVSVKELYSTFEKYMEDYCGYEKRDILTGRYGYWENPNAKWDWYQLGGRWTGFFKIKVSVDPHFGKILKGEPGLMTSTAKEGYADQLLKKHIDIEGMRLEAKEKAFADYDKVASFFINGIPKLDVSWEDLLKEEDIPVDEKRTIYHTQTGMLAWKNVVDNISDKDDRSFMIWKSVSDYQLTRQEYADYAAKCCLSTFAVVKDGMWHERGEMGWWGAVTNEKDKSDWDSEFDKLLTEIPDDILVSIYDCHI